MQRREIRKGVRLAMSIGVLSTAFFMMSCHSDGTTTNTNNNNNNNNNTTSATIITVDPAATHQTMIGFGGALAWYSDRIITSSNKTAISQLLFQDLGTDILRIKTWYYPDNYPTNKSTDNMVENGSTPDGASGSLTNSGLLYTSAKTYNPNMKILLTSWGPPAGLKSNSSSREGTLKSDGNGFMYDAFAQYWSDILDHTPFNPDYISIQNEPSFTNAGWTTCQWSGTETATLPGYDKAFDKVYDKIKTRSNPPLMLGLESANIAGSTFSSFADPIKDRPSLAVYGYHPYNFNSSTTPDQTVSLLKTVATYSKPSIMTEFSDNLDWFNTALFINNTLTQANTSGYVYWKMTWDKPSTGTDAALISIDASGNYTVTPFYYLMKHYAKYIDPGYVRVDASTTAASLKMSAFVNPAQTQLTLVVINTSSTLSTVDFKLASGAISKTIAKQSIINKLYTDLGDNTGKPITLPPNSITTVVMDYTK